MRLYTVEQANAALPKVREHLGALRAALEEVQFLRDQLADLDRYWAGNVKRAGSLEHEEHAELTEQAGDLEQLAEEELAALHALGVEVKDPVLGLVDFPSEREGELVYLCWKEGEDSVAHWHTPTAGFAGRAPL